MFKALPPKLIDCLFEPVGAETELLIVEGDSAANAVANARNSNTQAVLPMQGKPLNAWKANKANVAKNAFYSAIIGAVGAGWDDTFELSLMRYQRIVLLFDPDADGIHCSMLVLMFFHRWMKPLLESGRIVLIRPPQCQIIATGMPDRAFVGMPNDAIGEVRRLEQLGYQNVVRKPYRGLASMGAKVLSQYCIDPSTRQSQPMRPQDAEAAIHVFCGT